MQQASDRAAATGKLVAAFSTVLATAVGGGWLYIGKLDASRARGHIEGDRCLDDAGLRGRRQARLMRQLRAANERIARQDALLVQLSAHLSRHVANPRRKLRKPPELTRAEENLED